MDDLEPEEPEPQALPPVPAFPLVRVSKLRKELAEVALLRFYGCPIRGDNFQSLAATLAKSLKLKGAARDALADSLRYLLGRDFDMDVGRELAWRLAGNLERLKAGEPVPPWTAQRGLEWVPVQVTGGRKSWKKAEKGRMRFGWTYLFTVLAGSPTGRDIRQWWTTDKAAVVGARLGFSRKPPYHREDMDELVGLRFCALLDPKLSDRGPGFHHIHCPSTFEEYNREVIKKRRRIDFACPEGFPHSCSQCFVGTRECPAAVHRETYVSKYCTGCGREWWFDTDPRFVNDYCIHCQPRAESGIELRFLEETN